MADMGEDVVRVGEALLRAQQSGDRAKIAFFQKAYDAALARAQQTADGFDTGYRPSAGPLSPVVDRIHAVSTGVLDGVPVLGPTLTNVTDQSTAALNNVMGGTATPEVAARRREAEWKQFPVETFGGKMAGGVLGIGALATLPAAPWLLGMTGSPQARVINSTLSSGLIGGADAAARDQDALVGALFGAGTGFGFSVLGTALQGLRTRKDYRELVKTLKDDGIDIENIMADIDKRGVNEVLADMGPNTQRLAKALANRPGPARDMLVKAFQKRRAEATDEVRAALDEIMGPAIGPARWEEAFGKRAAQLSDIYGGLDYSRPVNAQPVANRIEAMLPRMTRGGTDDKALRSVLKMLRENDGGDLAKAGLITNGYTLHGVRIEIDKLMQDPNLSQRAKEVLGDIRPMIDKELGAKVPGIKDVDKEWATLQRQQEAYKTGRKSLDTGNPIWPDQFDALAKDKATALPVQGGQRDAIAEMFGASGRDIPKLKKLVQSEGDWNYMKIASAYGKDVADEVYRTLESGVRMNTTENAVLGGSDTLMNRNFDELVAPPKAPKGLLGQVDRLTGMIPELAFNAASKAWSDKTNARIASLLLMKPTPDVVDKLTLTKMLMERPSRVLGTGGAAGATQELNDRFGPRRLPAR